MATWIRRPFGMALLQACARRSSTLLGLPSLHYMLGGLLWMLAACAGAAQPPLPLVLSPATPSVNAWPAITVAIDATGQQSVHEVLAQPGLFAPPERTGGSLGVRKETVWLRLPLVLAQATNEPWIVGIDYSSLREVDFYLVQGGQVVQQALQGYLRPRTKASQAGRTPAMAMHLEAETPYEVLIRVRTLGPLILPITVSEASRHAHETLREQTLQGLVNGLALCLLVYSLTQWLIQRERLFGHYALVVFGSSLFSLQFFGIGVQFLWPGNVWMEAHVGIAAGLLALTGSFLFLGHTLAPQAPRGPYRRAMQAGALVTTSLCALYLLDVITARLATALMSLFGLLPTLLSIPIAVQRARQGDPIGTTLLAAWTAYGLAAGVMVGLVQGWLPANFWTLHSFQFGATLDMLLFLRVLGLRAQGLRRQAEQALDERDAMRSLALTDPLTGLSNRRGLQLALQSALSQCAGHDLVAVYLMDLDGFKPVNDAYGHDVGDALLVAVAHRLQSKVRHHMDVVARPGGDEFIVMACGLSSPDKAEELGRSLLHAFDHPFKVAGQLLTVGLTIGYALAPLDGEESQGLIRLADAAMYAGKQSGKRTLRRNRGDLALSS